MDVRLYFQKVRLVEAELKEPFVIVVSLDTPDGGKAGQLTEVTRFAAARLIVDGKARAASVEEAEDYRREVQERKLAADAAEAASKVHVTVVHETDTKGQRLLRPKVS